MYNHVDSNNNANNKVEKIVKYIFLQFSYSLTLLNIYSYNLERCFN